MITRSPEAFLKAFRALPADGQVAPRAIMMVEPTSFRVDGESALDNPYMHTGRSVDPDQALAQFNGLADAVEATGVRVVRFPGSEDTPDAVFCNNAFATAIVDGEKRFVVGAMRHPGRRREVARLDIPVHFDEAGYTTYDLSTLDLVAELTGVLVLDRARHVAFCGMTGRVDEAGLEAMREAFGLRLIFAFDLCEGEYHTNVVMQVLAGRAVVLCPDAFSDPAVPEAIIAAYPGRAVAFSTAEKNAFAANCLAVTENDVMISATGLAAMTDANREALESWGFVLHAAVVDVLEEAGGSVRCMLAEVF